MPFNSFEYILLFLPITFLIFNCILRFGNIIGPKIWLIFASLLFYGLWNVEFVPVLLCSMVFNYNIGKIIQRFNDKTEPREARSSRGLAQKVFLFIGIGLNICVLIYFKYSNFIISILNQVLYYQIAFSNATFPIGISLFTFIQIAYLIDLYRNEIRKVNFLNYVFFSSFFPYIISGPIPYYKEIAPQLEEKEIGRINYKNLATGLSLFFIGLFKKVILADSLGELSDYGFDQAGQLNFFGAWFTSLAYTFQIYFDFSGYSDMAIGTGLIFNVKIPWNFNSPYKALNIREFWRRWHITLSRFLQNYIYIPLGGRTHGEMKSYRNLLITFFICGIWHGAGLMFIVWGLAHGVALVIYRIWGKTNIRLPKAFAWLITFNFLNLSWIFFRAKGWDDAVKVISGMINLNGFSLPARLENRLLFLKNYGVEFGNWMGGMENPMLYLSLIILSFSIVLIMRNSNEWISEMRPNRLSAALIIIASFLSLTYMERIREFLYFKF